MAKSWRYLEFLHAQGVLSDFVLPSSDSQKLSLDILRQVTEPACVSAVAILGKTYVSDLCPNQCVPRIRKFEPLLHLGFHTCKLSKK